MVSASHTGRYFGWVAGGCLSVPCSSAILSKTCGPPTKASFGPTEALVDVVASAAWDVSTSPGAIVKFFAAASCFVFSVKICNGCCGKRRDLEQSLKNGLISIACRGRLE